MGWYCAQSIEGGESMQSVVAKAWTKGMKIAGRKHAQRWKVKNVAQADLVPQETALPAFISNLA